MNIYHFISKFQNIGDKDMNKDPFNTIITLVNAMECAIMRETFLKLQEDENSTNEQLVDDATKWNSYLDAYCVLYRKMNKNIPIH